MFWRARAVSGMSRMTGTSRGCCVVGVRRMDISVFGQGKVGLVLGVCLAAVGHRVVGVDVNHEVVARINSRSIASSEPGVIDLLQEIPPERLRATVSADDAIATSNVTFLIVPTPSNSFGGFSLRYVLAASREIGMAMRDKTTVHTIAVASTMLPGSSVSLVIPALEAASGMRVGEEFDYCYNPAFIALGEVVRGFERPDFLLIGEATDRAGDTIEEVHRSVMVNGAPVARMTPTEAEICKLASNTHETMRVSFANMLLAVCSEIPKANVDRITNALVHRMGRRFFKGAVPFGGPCWPRDNEALAVTMDALGVPARMPRAVDAFNAEHGRYVLRKVLELTSSEAVVGVVGLAYKPGTEVIERSFGVYLADRLAAEGRRVVGWDPIASGAADAVLGGRATMADSLAECLSRSNIVVIVNPLMEVETLRPRQLAGKSVIDCWRCLPAHLASAAEMYVPLGVGPSSATSEPIPEAFAQRLSWLAH